MSQNTNITNCVKLRINQQYEIELLNKLQKGKYNRKDTYINTEMQKYKTLCISACVFLHTQKTNKQNLDFK